MFARLRQHPGTPIAISLSILGFLAGLDGGIARAFIGATIMSVLFGVPVLLTLPTRGETRRNKP